MTHFFVACRLWAFPGLFDITLQTGRRLVTVAVTNHRHGTKHICECTPYISIEPILQVWVVLIRQYDWGNLDHQFVHYLTIRGGRLHMVGIFTSKNSSLKQVNLPIYVGCSYLMTNNCCVHPDVPLPSWSALCKHWGWSSCLVKGYGNCVCQYI